MGGGFTGSKIQKSGKPTKRLDQLAPNLAHKCGFIWEWTYTKNNSSSRPQVALGGGGLGVNISKVWKIYQTSGPIGAKFGTRLRIHLGMGIFVLSIDAPVDSAV